jgi:hypothetical protein
MTQTVRLLWLTITVQTSTITALLAGVLSRAGGHPLPDALTTAAVAFAGAEGLLLAVLGFALGNGRAWRR